MLGNEAGVVGDVIQPNAWLVQPNFPCMGNSHGKFEFPMVNSCCADTLLEKAIHRCLKCNRMDVNSFDVMMIKSFSPNAAFVAPSDV